jgi:hypothetical protein
MSVNTNSGAMEVSTNKWEDRVQAPYIPWQLQPRTDFKNSLPKNISSFLWAHNSTDTVPAVHTKDLTWQNVLMDIFQYI